MRLTTGDAAPDFVLLDHTAAPLSLKGLLGQRILLYIYPKANTPGCTTEAKDFNDELACFEEHKCRIIGLSPDPPEVLASFRAQYDLAFTLLSDPNLETIQSFGAYGVKKLYGREITGVFRSTFVIDQRGIIEHALYNVKATGHGARMSRLITTS
jgi:peroxiredoxin Q/BCP